MNEPITLRPLHLAFASVVVFAAAATHARAEVVARIESLSGSVRITAANGAARPVAVGASVSAGDTIRTGAASSVRLRMNDGSLRRIGSRQTVTLLGSAPVPTPTPSPSPPPASGNPVYDNEMAIFLATINAYRAANGRQPLQVSVAVSKAAAWMSQDMAAKNYFSHTDSLGRDPFVRMAAFGYDYNTWKGENIAAGYADACATFNQWKNSSGHNANMLNPNFRVIARVLFICLLRQIPGVNPDDPVDTIVAARRRHGFDEPVLVSGEHVLSPHQRRVPQHRREHERRFPAGIQTEQLSQRVRIRRLPGRLRRAEPVSGRITGRQLSRQLVSLAVSPIQPANVRP